VAQASVVAPLTHIHTGPTTVTALDSIFY